MVGVNMNFEVIDVIEREDLNAVVIRGRMQNGSVSSGMSARVWVDGGLYMKASIKNVEHEGEVDEVEIIKLILDTPEADVRELWLELCQPGDVLPIEINA